MRALRKMTELERIAYRRGFDDGLAAMREKIKDLLPENAPLRDPILGPAHAPAAARNGAADRISGADLDSWPAQPGPAARLALVPASRCDRAVASLGAAGRREHL